MTATGTLVVDAAARTLSFFPSGASSPTTVRSGVLVNQGTSFNPNVVVFDFTSINIGANVTVAVFGSNPVALLSRGNMTISTDVDVTGLGATGGGGGTTSGAGSGPGGGPASRFFAAGGGSGGGYGGVGGLGTFAGVLTGGGSAYGDLTLALQTGSGGSGGHGSPATAGGAGGGALELGATGSLTVTGDIIANGLSPPP